MEVLEKGFLTIPVSGARHGLERYGVSAGGPMDPCRYVLANRLVGNDDNAGALEITMLLPKLRFTDARTVALVSGPCDAAILRNGERIPLPVGESVRVQAGDELSGGAVQAGCRGYLAVSGGIRRKSLRSRPVAAGEKLTLGESRDTELRAIENMPVAMPEKETVLRVLEGVHAGQFSPDGLNAFYGNAYSYTPQSDRMGIRLAGETISFSPGCDGNIISEGMMCGDLQVTSAGQPILMMADCQTVGGYTKIAHVIRADLALAAQLKPGDTVRFRRVEVSEAQAAWMKLCYRMEQCVKAVHGTKRDR